MGLNAVGLNAMGPNATDERQIQAVFAAIAIDRIRQVRRNRCAI